jgi:hypothetical protein
MSPVKYKSQENLIVKLEIDLVKISLPKKPHPNKEFLYFNLSIFFVSNDYWKKLEKIIIL